MILTRYKGLLACVPFPFEFIVTANNVSSATRKAKFQAKLHGLKPGRLIDITVDSRFEIENKKEVAP